MPTIRLLACGTAAAGILALAAGFGTARAVVPTAAHVVAKIENFTFEPHDLTVAPGTTVTWTNETITGTNASNVAFSSSVGPGSGTSTGERAPWGGNRQERPV